MSSTTIAIFGIGSTNCRSAVGAPDGTFQTDIHVEPTRVSELATQVVERLERLDALVSDIDAVAIACGGLIDGTVVTEMDTPDGAVVRDILLGEAVTDAFDLPVIVENDCTAAALAEWTYGAGRAYDTVAHVTIGTGIGAGVVDRGHVLRGEHGQAAEVGLFSVAPQTRTSSGVPGAWEAYCSGRGIAGFVEERLQAESRDTALASIVDLTARDVFAAAANGDAVAEAYLDQLGRYNALGLGAVINAYNPGLLTIGGGVGRSNFAALSERIDPHLDTYALPPVPEIGVTDLGDEIGLYGALAATRQSQPRTSAGD